MYQVLIADDEPMIREGLCSLIPWHQYGFHIQGTAKNGEEALMMYNRLKPDLMIVDIRMPKMGGLELIETIRQRDSSIRFLILTGHADFSYAKQALFHKVDGYLLKPLDEEELIVLLQQIQAELVDHSVVNKLLEKESTIKKHQFISQALTQESEWNSEVFYQYCHQFRLTAKRYKVMLFHMQQSDECTINELTRLEETSSSCMVFPKPQVGIILLEEATNIEERLRHYVQTKNGYASMGTEVADPIHLKHSYTNALDLLSHVFLFEDSTIVTNEHLSREPLLQSKEEFDIDGYVKDLTVMITLGLNDSCKKMIHRIRDEFILRREQPITIQKTMVHLYSMVVNKLVLHDTKKLAQIESIAFNPSIIYDQPNLYAVAEVLTHRFIELMNVVYAESKASTVEKIIELIDNQFADHLRLEGIAELLNYNAAYLGKLFREQTGEYFNTYLDKSRIKYGKVYLEQGFKVYEVSEKVGYKDVDYFHRKFKKYVGQSPRAFQKQQILLKKVKQSNIQ